MNESDQERVRRILRAAGFSERSIEWMVASCPDVQTAERFYGVGGNPYLVEEET